MLLYANTTYKIRRAIFNVYNTLGYGHKEKVYEKALIKEFDFQEIKYSVEKNVDVKYRGEKIGSYRLDFIVENLIIIEIKAVEFVPKSYETQLFHYLKSTDFKVGFLVNFGSNKLYIKRFI